MKHALAFIFALVLSVSCLGAELDFSSMSTEEIYEVIDAARAEVSAREQEGDFVLVDQDGFQVTLSGKKSFTDSCRLDLKGTIVNNSDETLMIGFDDCYVNGWKSFALAMPSQVEAHKKAKMELSVDCEGIVKKAKKIEDILLYIHISDASYMHRDAPDMRITFSEGKIVSIDQATE